MQALLKESDQKDMNFSMRLSFVVGLFMLITKVYAYFITGSAAILSDAAESVIHVFAVGFAAYSMWLSLKPADHDHLYGHDKVSFFSAGFEGAMIIIASCFIIYESIYKMIYGFELVNVNSGMLYMFMAVLTNLLLSIFLIRKGKKYRSIILEANGKHILTDCWTSLGVIIALICVQMTGISFFDPLIAICIGVNILWTGSGLLKKGVNGLMDTSDKKMHRTIEQILTKITKEKSLAFHNLKDRVSGYTVFIEFHLLFPNDISLENAHDIASEIESSLKQSIDMKTEILTHLEPQNQHDLIHKKYGLPI